MKLVHFTRFDGKDSISFVQDKIIAFCENSQEPEKTSIFVLSAGGDNDEFVVADNYRQVVSILENAL